MANTWAFVRALGVLLLLTQSSHVAAQSFNRTICWDVFISCSAGSQVEQECFADGECRGFTTYTCSSDGSQVLVQFFPFPDCTGHVADQYVLSTNTCVEQDSEMFVCSPLPTTEAPEIHTEPELPTEPESSGSGDGPTQPAAPSTTVIVSRGKASNSSAAASTVSASVIGIAIAVACIILLAVVIAIVVVRRRRQRGNPEFYWSVEVPRRPGAQPNAGPVSSPSPVGVGAAIMDCNAASRTSSVGGSPAPPPRTLFLAAEDDDRPPSSGDESTTE